MEAWGLSLSAHLKSHTCFVGTPFSLTRSHIFMVKRERDYKTSSSLFATAVNTVFRKTARCYFDENVYPAS